MFNWIKKHRWQKAQRGEARWWENWLKENPDAQDNEWLGTVLNYFELEEGHDFENETLVDIGSGPIGVLTKLKASKKVAVDPISISTVDSSIERIIAPGEKTTLPDSYADRVFMYNCLQHVCSPETVLNEIYRILKKDGTAYILEQLNLPTDREHPHSLKIKLFKNWLQKNNFQVIKETQEQDCYFDHPHTPGCGYSILCLCVKKSQ